MNLLTLLSLAAVTSVGVADTSVSTSAKSINATCNAIAAAVSSASGLYYNGSTYDLDMYHWASSSTQQAVCAFEPGTAQDVAIALQIIGKNKCPFAVKGGGHATNPGFSSTIGVQIAMYRFSEVTYNSAAQTVTIGAGLIWDDVYAALEPYGVNVVGGRVTGVGVAGLTLGGGYSWLTNQHGLTIDTVTAYELVLPSGSVVNVTQSSNPSLFFALKGGYNNFGIVTSFTLQAFPQGQVWGGSIYYNSSVVDQVTAATAAFSANCTDPKAQIITTYNYISGELIVSELLFYDAPTAPSGIFDQFLAIPALQSDISTRSFLSLVQSSGSNQTAGLRGVFNTVSVTGYPLELLNAIVNETTYWGETLGLPSGTFISYDVEPFLPTIFTHNTSSSAYPGSRKLGVFPLNLYFAWTDSSADQQMQAATRTSASTLYNKAIALGQSIQDAPLYNNYAIFSTPLQSIYGDNVDALHSIKKKVDPANVMGLAGGFKF
ncbi:FAD-binding domain-containing protein [Scleroderma citrinum]